MDDHLDGYDSRDPSMERVVCSKIPAGHPKEDIVAASKEPKNRYVCHCQDASSISHSSKHLDRYAIPTRISSQHAVLYSSLLNDDQCMDVLKIIPDAMINHRREDDVDGNVYENQNRRNPCWQCTPAERLLMSIAKSCGKCDISSDQPTDPTLSRVGFQPAASLRISVCSACRIMYRRCEQAMTNPEEEYDSPEIVHCQPVMSSVR